MQQLRRFRRVALVTLSLLPAFAAAGPAIADAAPPDTVSGVFGHYLAGRVAMSDGDASAAASSFLAALAKRPRDPEMLQQAFFTTLMAGRPEAGQLARNLPDNPIAQLVVGSEAAKSGNWKEAERCFRGLPRQGLTQLLGPLLVAWAQQGGNRTDAALDTLRPLVEGQRFRGLFALHAGMIADVANRQADAGRFFHTAETEMPDSNLRLAQILASWHSRSGHAGAAQRSLSVLVAAAPDMAIAMSNLIATANKRPIARATDGMAEAFVALGAALHAQQAPDYATAMFRLALGLRPDLTAARIMQSDVLTARRLYEPALDMLAAVPPSDPIISVVRLRRAAILDKMERTDEATQELERLARDYPDSPLPELALGDDLRVKQKFAQAVVAYDRAATRIHQLGASDWRLYYSRGISHERLGNWQKAEFDLRRALELAPDQPAVLNYLGYSLADMNKDLAEARRMIQRAAERRPNDGAITDSLGWVMYRQGQIAEAVRTLERAVELDSDDATINGHLGDAYRAAGREIEAQYQWRRALTLNPAADDVAKLEAKLNPTRGGAVVSGQ